MGQSLNIPQGFEVVNQSSQNLALPEGFEVVQSRPTSDELEKWITRPSLQTAKNIAVGTIGQVGDLAQEAVNLPYYLGFKGAQKATELVTGKKSNAEFKPLFGEVNSISPQIRRAFDESTGNLTAPRNKGEQIIQDVGEIFGGIVGPGAAEKVTKGTADFVTVGGKKLLQKYSGITPKSRETLRAFEEAGVNPTLANISEGQTTKTFQNLLGNFPGSRGVIEKATQDQVDNIARQIAGVTKSEGGTIQQTGKKLQEGAKNLRNLITERGEKLFENLDKYIPKDSYGNRAKVATDHLATAVNDPTIQDVAAVKEGTIQRIINRYQKLADPDGDISYDRLKIFRGTLGKESYSPLLSETERGAAKYLYGALTHDMKYAVNKFGKEAGLRAFDKANNAFYRHIELLNSKINPLIEADTPEMVYSMALKGSKQGGSNIKVIMKSLDPTQQDFVRGTMARRMGLAKKGEQDDMGDVFSPSKFLSEWNDLSPEARSNIFQKDQIAAIDNLNKAIHSIKQTTKARQSSNNLPYAAWAGLGGVTVTNPLAGLGAVGGARITAGMMTNPKILNWLAKTPKVRPAQIPQHLKTLSIIASQNPAIREDILNYLDSITIDKSQPNQTKQVSNKLSSNEDFLSENQIQQSLENQKKTYPGLYYDVNPSERARQINQRYNRGNNV